MKSFLFVLISSLVGSMAGAAASAPCGYEVFLSKVCVSDQSLPLDGQEIQRLQCADRALHPNIYSTLKDAFLMSPAWFQHRLCGVDRIGVYNPEPTTVLSWSYFSGHGFIGISKERFDQGYDLKAHAATMMKHAKKYKTIPEGREFPASFGYQVPDQDSSGGILYLLAHELGHIVYNPSDETARSKYFYDCYGILGSWICPNFKENQFGYIDWITGLGHLNTTIRGKARPEGEVLRSYILADEKTEHTPEKADAFFKGLNSSSFVSPFALFSPEEDFCETFAHVVMSESARPLEFHYLAGDKVSIWDRIRHVKDGKLKAKVDFVNRLMKE